MADIFIEVDEALKQEKLENLWQKYGGFFIGFLSVIVLGTAANAGYKSWEMSKNAAQTDILFSVTTKANYTAADLQNIAPELQAGLRSITGLHAAGLYLPNGENEKALLAYKSLVEDKNTDPTIKQLAFYMITSISTEIKSEDKVTRLDTIISDAENPWRHHAMLDAAVLQANTAQDFSRARQHLSSILSSNAAPDSLKQKAHSLDILYALEEKI